MATLWLSNNADKNIKVGDSVTLTAYMNPTGLSSSSTSSYRSKMVVDGSVVGSAKKWSVSGSNWKTSCSYTFSSAGTYEVGIALCDSSGSYVGGGMMTGTITVYVEDTFKPPTITIPNGACSSTSDSVTIGCRISAPSSGKFYVKFEISYLGMSKSHTSSSFSLSDGGSRDLTWTFSGIPSDTDVTAYVRVYDYSTDEQYDYDRTTITTQGKVPPSNWSWTSTVSKGSAMPYTRSGDVITCTPLTAEEWNSFVDRVAAFRAYFDIYGDISALYVTKGSAMNYDVPDAMRQVIAGMNPPIAVPPAIVSGGKITAAFINGLKNSLNSIKREDFSA